MSIWAQGFEMEGARYDAPKCKPGNKPCGARCIPDDWNCGATNAATVAAVAGGIAAGIYGFRRLRKGKKAGGPPLLPGGNGRVPLLPEGPNGTGTGGAIPPSSAGPVNIPMSKQKQRVR